jgi:ABC-type cobalamin/Fe3+-siderophores transport system ATPase subunit
LLVSHDLQLATQYATHVALFNAGKVQAGTAADLLTAPILKQLYGTQQLPHCLHCLTAHV